MLDVFGSQWANIVLETGFSALNRGDLATELTVLAGDIADALLTDPFSDEAGFRTGVALVHTRLTDVVVLRKSSQLLSRLPRIIGRASPETAVRMSMLIGALGAGFAHALKEQTVHEQETIHSAVLAARGRAELALRASEERFRAVFEGAAIAVAICDVNGTFLDVNPVLANMVGEPTSAIRGRSVFDFVHPDDAIDMHREVFDKLARGEAGRAHVEKRFRRGNGEMGWTRLALSLVRSEDGSPDYLVAMGEDVTERHQLQHQLRHQALHDPLTGLPNRSLLYEKLDETFSRSRHDGRIGLLFLDLDGFKVINDRLGHGTGDRLLVEVADRLHATVTKRGHMVARIGGDEFVVLVSDSPGLDDLTVLADEILDTIKKPIKVDEHALPVNASIGIVERPIAGTEPAELMRAADSTMYWAKAEGKGRWRVYDEQRSEYELFLYRLESEMAGALDRGEFILNYQPLVGLEDGRIRGLEALIRWMHPEYGLLSPDKFIPKAEENGFILELGRWVLQQACMQGKAWQLSGAQPFVSVNVAMLQCTEGDLRADVLTALEHSGLAPEKLQLEITESAMMGGPMEPVAVLGDVVCEGVRVAIDDFGTGYSNWSALRRLPVHDLKLAGAFVEGLRPREGSLVEVDTRIVGTMISMAHALGLSVTAENVETQEQATRLRELGCDAGQGWLFAKPMSVLEVDKLLAANGRFDTGF
ncbi:EAL domain-containing protein [Pseudonocardiaceae bacterium YIM PH 21723]|nr:EAL domain-containing protein [Pseudonocardiaceae bacterium YIM PH 21723]